jgi:hypothetical protein
MKRSALLGKTWLLIGALTLIATVCGDPRKPGTPTPTPTALPDEDAPDPSTITLPGTVIVRPKDKGYLSLTIESGGFKLSFYDVNKQLTAADVLRATARWNPKQKFGEEHSILNLTADRQSLKGVNFVQPPFPIRVFITLLNAQDVSVESYSVNFRP